MSDVTCARKVATPVLSEMLSMLSYFKSGTGDRRMCSGSDVVFRACLHDASTPVP